MIHPDTLRFLLQLKANNNKEWMDANKKAYQAAKADFEAFVTQLLQELIAIEPDFSGLEARKCIFRINRDVRFSQDKSPYKANFGAAFSAGGKQAPDAGYYFHLEPGGKSFIGGGMWMPESIQLKKIRQEIDYNYKDFETLLQQPAFHKLFPHIDGERLKKAPQGYSPEHPAIEYLRLKSFTVGHALSDKMIGSKMLLAHSRSVFETMKPFVDFLNKAVT